jgi:multiple sugar transport system permease protein
MVDLARADARPPSFLSLSPAIRRRRLAHMTTGLAMIAPGFLLIVGLIAYPFLMSLYLSLTDGQIRSLLHPNFVGLQHYIRLLGDEVFLQTVVNSFVFTIASVALKILLGLAMALLLYAPFRGRRAVLSILLFSWVAPIALTVLAWLWLYDSLYSPINWVLVKTGLMSYGPSWLGDRTLAMISVVVVNVWRGFPFFGLMILAGMLGIPRSLYEAADVDGATAWQKFRLITLPMLRIVLIILILYATIFTFNEFAVVQVLTRGGPENATQVFSTLAFQRGVLSGNIGEAAAITLYFFPVFALLSIFLLRLSGKEKEI